MHTSCNAVIKTMINEHISRYKFNIRIDAMEQVAVNVFEHLVIVCFFSA